ncbi:MAG: hypothetical protein ACE5OO_00795 [Candidatus Bathyarchaeia archaeon]
MADLKGIWEILKQVRHRRPQPKFCPSCRGHNIISISKLGILPTTYICRDCGYRGTLFLEIDPEPREDHRPDRAESDP